MKHLILDDNGNTVYTEDLADASYLVNIAVSKTKAESGAVIGNLNDEIEDLKYEVYVLRKQIRDLLPWALHAARTLRDGDIVGRTKLGRPIGKPESYLLIQQFERDEFGRIPE